MPKENTPALIRPNWFGAIATTAIASNINFVILPMWFLLRPGHRLHFTRRSNSHRASSWSRETRADIGSHVSASQSLFPVLGPRCRGYGARGLDLHFLAPRCKSVPQRSGRMVFHVPHHVPQSGDPSQYRQRDPTRGRNGYRIEPGGTPWI